MSDKTPTGLALLRAPFPANQISKLPKPTKKQTDDVKADFKAGIRCQICGGWHHKDVVHLDYVGHAALTHRLLDCDPAWNWEPMALLPNGAPALDANGGLWIKLTVCGVTRLGYGHADGKAGGDAIKEVIGDAMRNAAMRFGAALDLWHKGDLEVEDAPVVTERKADTPQYVTSEQIDQIIAKVFTADITEAQVCKAFGADKFAGILAKDFAAVMKKLDATIAAKKPKNDDLNGDFIPEFERQQ